MNGRVEGELEAMRYPPPYWNLFTDEQKQKVGELRRRASQTRKASQVTTGGGGSNLTEADMEGWGRRVAAAAVAEYRSSESAQRSVSRGREGRDRSRERDTRGDYERNVRQRRSESHERGNDDNHSGRRPRGGRR